MIMPMGSRVPRLFFVDEGGEPYYFKEELILPGGTLTKPEKSGDESDAVSYYRDTVLYCARMSAEIEPHRPLSARIIATYRLARMLGIGDIVARSEAATLEVGGETLTGTRIPPISGAIYTELVMLPQLRGYRVRYSPEAVRELTILATFDFVCGQIDRHSKNIKLFTNLDINAAKPLADGDSGEITVTGVCAIDHDLSFGTLSYEYIKGRVAVGMCISPELLGGLHYPAVDMEFCERLFALADGSFRREFSDILSEAEIDAFLDRLEGLRRVVERERDLERGREQTRAAEAGADGEDASSFPRLITDASMYGELLARMEADPLAYYRPTYLKLDFLRGDPLPGGEA